MPSRDVRRWSRKKGETGKEEKKVRRSPVLYGFSVVVLVIIAISFIGGPLLSRLTGGGSRIYFGSYDGRAIEYVRGNYFAGQYDYIADQIRQTDQEGNLESQLWQAWRYAFDQTVLHTAIMAEADRSGLWVSNDRVNESLLEYGPYLVNGVFDQKKYQATPRAEKSATVKRRREELTQTQYLIDHLRTVHNSSRELELVKNMASRQRSFSFIHFDFADFPIDRVREYGMENLDRFRKIRLSRITINASKAEAEKVRELALAGSSSFEDLARSYSKGFYADKGGDMGWQFYHQLEIFFDSQEPVQSIFSLTEGEISDVFASGRSWLFFRVDSEPVDPDLEDQEITDIVKSYILNNEKGVIESYFLAEAEDIRDRAEETDFAAASLENGLIPKDTEYFPVNYGGIFEDLPVRVKGDDSALLSSAASNEDFFVTLFSLEEGGISDPVLLSDKVLLVALLDERESQEDLLSERAAGLMITRNLETDLRLNLIQDDLLEDRFQDAFYTYIIPQR
jgi:hypothetical protein